MSATSTLAPGSIPREPAEIPAGKRPAKAPFLFYALLAFFVMDYVRPPVLSALKLQMLFILAVPVLWLGARERPWSKSLTLTAAFIAIGSCAMPFAHNYFSVYISTRIMFGNMMVALAITWVLGDLALFKKAMWFYVGMMTFQALYAIASGGHGHGDFMGDENDLALGLITAFPFAFRGLQNFSGRARLYCLASTVLLAAGIVASSSRGGFIGFVAAGVFCVLVGKDRGRNIAIGCGAALIFFIALPSTYKEEISSIQETDTGTAETRLFLWTAAINMWKDYPIFGVGPGNSKWWVGTYQPEPTAGGLFKARHFTERDWTMKALHSVYFELLASHGLVGVVLYTWLAVTFFTGLGSLQRRARARGRPPDVGEEVEFYALAVKGSMVGFMAAGSFLSVLMYPYFWHLSAMAVALERAAQKEFSSAGPLQRKDDAATA